MISARNAGLIYGNSHKETHACRNIEMEVLDSEFIGILGPSGSGKSSLVFLLSGLKNPSYGEVSFEGCNYAEMSETQKAALRLSKFGFVFQQPYLLGYLSSLENVLIGRKQTEEQSRAEDLLDQLGVGDKAHSHPAELSGGERQRVCVARALFGNPSVIFADEPTASLDHENGAAVIDLLATNRSGALVVVTHDPSMLRRADRVFAIEDGRAHELSEQQRRAVTVG